MIKVALEDIMDHWLSEGHFCPSEVAIELLKLACNKIKSTSQNRWDQTRYIYKRLLEISSGKTCSEDAPNSCLQPCLGMGQLDVCIKSLWGLFKYIVLPRILTFACKCNTGTKTVTAQLCVFHTLSPWKPFVCILQTLAALSSEHWLTVRNVYLVLSET